MLVELDNVHKIGFFTCIEYKAQKKYFYKFQNLIELAQRVKLEEFNIKIRLFLFMLVLIIKNIKVWFICKNRKVKESINKVFLISFW